MSNSSEVSEIHEQAMEDDSVQESVEESVDESKTENTKVVCAGCHKEYKNARGLAIHAKKCKSPAEFPCTACQAVFSKKSGLATHLKTCKVIKQKEQQMILEKKEMQVKEDYEGTIRETQKVIQKIKDEHVQAMAARDLEWKSRLESELHLRDLHYSHLQKSYAQLQDERSDLIRQRERLETQLAEAMKEMSMDKHRLTDLATKFLEKAMTAM